MVRLPKSPRYQGKHLTFNKADEATYDINTDGEVVSYVDNEGNEYVFTKLEAGKVVTDLINQLFDDKISKEGDQMVRKAIKELSTKVDDLH